MSIIPEVLLSAIAERHGFRAGDYALTWDGGKFDRSRDMHVMVIITRDGRESTAQLSHDAISQRDPWKYLGEIEAAFKRLARRKKPRGA